MVRSKEELRQCANAWVNQAKSDVRNKIAEFMRISGLSAAQLANILDVSERDIRTLLETNGEISLTFFAKLLIATDLVLEIKPLAETPLAAQMPQRPTRSAQRPSAVPSAAQTQPRDSHGRFTSRRAAQQQMPAGFGVPPMGGIPVDRNGRPLPPPPGYPMPHRFGGMPGMGGAVAPVPPTPEVIEEEPTVGGLQPLDELASHSRAELEQMIRDNFWDGEIDLEEASKSDIIAFLTEKRSHTQQPTQQPTTEAAPTDGSLAAFNKMLEDALAANPHLRDVIKQYAQ